MAKFTFNMPDIGEGIADIGHVEGEFRHGISP